MFMDRPASNSPRSPLRDRQQLAPKPPPRPESVPNGGLRRVIEAFLFGGVRDAGSALSWRPVNASTYDLRFNGELLQRGFWLYVWEVTPPTGAALLYVGRTGDSSSANAQSPFARMGQHLGFAKTSMMLRKHLDGRKVDPKACKFRLVSHGPVLPEAENQNMDLHRSRRDIVAAMERALCEELKAAGYDVLNTVNSRKALDNNAFASVRMEFAKHFPRLPGLRTASTQ